MANTDSIAGKSSDDLKQMLMQTSVPETGEETEVEAEAVEAPEETEEETTPEETTQQVETKQEVEAKEKAESLYKIKTRKGEIELPLEKLIERAQKGEDYEQKMARLNEERRKLATEKQQPATPGGFRDIESANKWFTEEVTKNPVGTILNVAALALENKDNQTREEKNKDREFEAEAKKEIGDELWPHMKESYQGFREMGLSREESLAKAETDIWKRVAAASYQKGAKTATTKAKLKEAANIPTGEKRSRGVSQLPSVDQAENMSSAEIAKFLRKTKNPNW